LLGIFISRGEKALMEVIGFLAIILACAIIRDMWKKIEELREIDEQERLIEEHFARRRDNEGV